VCCALWQTGMGVDVGVQSSGVDQATRRQSGPSSNGDALEGFLLGKKSAVRGRCWAAWWKMRVSGKLWVENKIPNYLTILRDQIGQRCLRSVDKSPVRQD
jgi:hypothetical protein